MLPGLSAVTVEISSEQRSGIPTANTGSDLAVQSQIPRGVQMPDTPFAGERHTAAVSGSRSGIAAKAESDSGKLSGDAGTAYGL